MAARKSVTLKVRTHTRAHTRTRTHVNTHTHTRKRVTLKVHPGHAPAGQCAPASEPSWASECVCGCVGVRVWVCSRELLTSASTRGSTHVYTRVWVAHTHMCVCGSAHASYSWSTGPGMNGRHQPNEDGAPVRWRMAHRSDGGRRIGQMEDGALVRWRMAHWSDGGRRIGQMVLVKSRSTHCQLRARAGVGCCAGPGALPVCCALLVAVRGSSPLNLHAEP
jgi:hypothetical protein